MIGDIAFFGLIGAIIFAVVIVFDRMGKAKSIDYFKYMHNNGHPPPEDRREHKHWMDNT